MWNKRIRKIIFTGLFIMIFIFTSAYWVSAEDPLPTEPENCEDNFVRYIVADPPEVMPNIDETTTVKFNLQCDHNVRVDVLNEAGGVVGTITGSLTLSSGDNQVVWDGKLSGADVEDGTYQIKVTPNDKFAKFAFSVQMTVRNFKFPSLIDIFDEEFKRNMREYRKGAQTP